MGLYLAQLLIKKGKKVRIFDSNNLPGGHARPFKFKKILIEIYYHFFYLNDHKYAMSWVKSLTKKKDHDICWKEINTSIITKDKKKLNVDNISSLIKVYKLDSFKILLNILLIFIFPVKEKIKKISAVNWSINKFGKSFSKDIWFPLLKGKFSKDYKKISAWWLATRIKRHLSTKRPFSPKCTFGYLTKSYKPIIDETLNFFQKNNSKFYGSHRITKFEIKNNNIVNIICNNKKIRVDNDVKVISTLPLFVNKKLFKNNNKFKYLNKFNGIGVLVCIFKSKKKISNDYWTTVSDEKLLFNAVIQQNRLFAVCKEEIVYTSKYLFPGDKIFKMNTKKISKLIFNQMSYIFPKFTFKDVIDFKIFKSISAAPSPTINTISNLPKLKSPLNNFWHGGLEYIYPEDRGVGNSIALSNKIFKEIL